MSGIELSISCTDCVRRSTPDCEDCLVTFVLGDEPEELTMSSIVEPGNDSATEVPSRDPRGLRFAY